MNSEKPRYAFFGTPHFAEIILNELEQKGFVPTLIITTPDRPKGRKLVITPSEVSVWGKKRNIPILTPERLRDESFLSELKNARCDLFIVAAYGKIIPPMLLDLPKYGVLNVHPSLLPKFRGASPIESVILSSETSTGVTIMLLDEEMDHGPIVASHEHQESNWPPKGSVLTEALAHEGGMLLAEIIPNWMSGAITPLPQDHSKATFTKKITKEDGLIDLSDDPLMNYKKIRAFDEWPGAHFFAERNGKKIRLVINDVEYQDGVLTITRVTPEGKKEMRYADFLRGLK